MWFLYHFIFIVATIHQVLSSCENKINCQECILDPAMCVWCAQKNMTIGNRCVSSKNVSSDWCSAEDVQRVRSSHKTIVDRDFSSDIGKVTQLKPQNMKLKLAVGDATTFNISFLAAKNYPVDMYFLIDASTTMLAMKKTVADEGLNIYNAMKNLTNNVFIGLGTFIDKNVIPFTISKDDLTYSFKHELKLTKNKKEFVDKVTTYDSGRNNDEPEGGFDALSQVMACKELIGWRNESRKIIIFMTDSPSHSAGDGKQAVIDTPHDGRCYMDENVYTKELEMDYPSVSLINKMATDNSFIIIFGLTTSDHVPYYKSLLKAIKGSKLEVIQSDNSIVHTLKTIYEDISRTLILRYNILNKKVSRNVKISFNPDCRSNTAECNIDNREKMVIFDFETTIKVLNYDGVDNFKISISPQGITEELVLDVDILNSCECESAQENNSTFCHQGGTLQCGICNCHDNRFGNNCRCTTLSTSGSTDGSSCKASPGEVECSGYGKCVCGKCECNEGFEGTYCNCNKISCPVNAQDGSTCSRHGKCECGVCRCDSGWTNEACDCAESKASCTDNSLVCSDRGDCQCGVCNCHPMPPWDVRNQTEKYCSIGECSGALCHGRQCDALVPCVLCYYNKEQFSPDCRDACQLVVPEFVEKINGDLYKSTDLWNKCSDISTAVGCYTNFFYQYKDKEIKIVIQMKSDCVQSYFLYGGISLGVVLLIGLLTLLAWKLLTDARDRREYEAFEKDHSAALWPETNNPAYKTPVTVYSNPAFGQNQ